MFKTNQQHWHCHLALLARLNVIWSVLFSVILGHSQFVAVAADKSMGSPSPISPSRTQKTHASHNLKKNLSTEMTWAGAQIVGDGWSVYTGTSTALYGSINENGWRMRIIGGYGHYAYNGTRRIDRLLIPTTFKGRSGFSDVLVGYHWQMDDLFLKAFAGISILGHTIMPFDPNNAVFGVRYGGSTALEIWLNLSDYHWLSAETTYATMFNSFNTTLRMGYRVWPKLSLGLEVGLVGNDDYTAAHTAGVFALDFGLFKANDSYLRISAGASADRNMELRPYANVNLAIKY